MARPAKLNGYSIKEVAKIELELKTTNKIVKDHAHKYYNELKGAN